MKRFDINLFAVPEQPQVDVWMQGGAVAECLEWGSWRSGDLVIVDGYLASSQGKTAVKPLSLIFLEEQK